MQAHHDVGMACQRHVRSEALAGAVSEAVHRAGLDGRAGRRLVPPRWRALQHSGSTARLLSALCLAFGGLWRGHSMHQQEAPVRWLPRPEQGVHGDIEHRKRAAAPPALLIPSSTPSLVATNPPAPCQNLVPVEDIADARALAHHQHDAQHPRGRQRRGHRGQLPRLLKVPQDGLAHVGELAREWRVVDVGEAACEAAAPQATSSKRPGQASQSRQQGAWRPAHMEAARSKPSRVCAWVGSAASRALAGGPRRPLQQAPCLQWPAWPAWPFRISLVTSTHS